MAIALENATLYRELKMMDRAKERVINHLAHELKTPISVVGGVIGNLAKKLRRYDSAKADKLEEMGRRNVRKLLVLQDKVDDIVSNRPVKEKDLILNIVKQAAGIVSDLMAEEEINDLILKKIFDRIESIYKVGETKLEEIYLKPFIEKSSRRHYPKAIEKFSAFKRIWMKPWHFIWTGMCLRRFYLD